jgi:hypothetical protein
MPGRSEPFPEAEVRRRGATAVLLPTISNPASPARSRGPRGESVARSATGSRRRNADRERQRPPDPSRRGRPARVVRWNIPGPGGYTNGNGRYLSPTVGVATKKDSILPAVRRREMPRTDRYRRVAPSGVWGAPNNEYRAPDRVALIAGKKTWHLRWRGRCAVETHRQGCGMQRSNANLVELTTGKG